MRRRRRRRRAGGRGGGPGAGRGWGYLGGPSGPGHPPGAGRSGGSSGRPGPRDRASPESSPGERGSEPAPGTLAARRLARPVRGAATRRPSPPGPRGQRAQLPQPAAAGTAGRPRRPAEAPPARSPPRWRLGARPRPGRSGRSGALLPFARTQLRALRPHPPRSGCPAPARQALLPPASASSGPAPPRPAARSPPSAFPDWPGLPGSGQQLGTGARDRGNLRPGLGLSLRSGRSRSHGVWSRSLRSLGLGFLIRELNTSPRGGEGGRSRRKVLLKFIIMTFSTHQVVLCLFFFFSFRHACCIYPS
ncbi:translation initiation factor IF-2-like [Pipistrellus kuhlii]|uniref:translation initiation factor IF-2-like n=1 Tax=Pipistrellus kuhlii TaxID=59472 RepID=UPI001E270EB3|nr:translation initiation factor IF-2-like [Pipistrellus kuhlii]